MSQITGKCALIRFSGLRRSPVIRCSGFRLSPQITGNPVQRMQGTAARIHDADHESFGLCQPGHSPHRSETMTTPSSGTSLPFTNSSAPTGPQVVSRVYDILPGTMLSFKTGFPQLASCSTTGCRLLRLRIQFSLNRVLLPRTSVP